MQGPNHNNHPKIQLVKHHFMLELLQQNNIEAAVSTQLLGRNNYFQDRFSNVLISSSDGLKIIMQSSIIMVLTSYSWLQTQNNEIESNEATLLRQTLGQLNRFPAIRLVINPTFPSVNSWY